MKFYKKNSGFALEELLGYIFTLVAFDLFFKT